MRCLVACLLGLGSVGCGHVSPSNPGGDAGDAGDTSSVAPKILAQPAYAPMVIDGTAVFYVTDRGVERLTKTDGTATLLAPYDPPSPGSFRGASSFALDDTTLYWMGSSPGKIAKAGGTPESIVLGGPDLRHAVAIAIDEADIFTIDQIKSEVLRLPKTGGVPATAISNGYTDTSLVVDAANVYWIELGIGGPHGPAMAVKSSASPRKLLSEDRANPAGIAADRDSVFWIDESSVKRIAKSGGDATTVTTASGALTLAVDETYVYFGVRDGLMRAPKIGGEASQVASGRWDRVTAIAVDDVSLYWTVNSSPNPLFVIAKR